jgi:hypothetical protein
MMPSPTDTQRLQLRVPSARTPVDRVAWVGAAMKAALDTCNRRREPDDRLRVACINGIALPESTD